MRIFLLIFTFLMLSSCNKENLKYIVRGRLLKGCGTEPEMFKTISLCQITRKPGLIVKEKKQRILATVTTDQYGRFSFEYSTKATNKNQLYIKDVDMDFFPSRVNKDFGILRRRNVANIFIKVKVINAYTSNDTISVFGLPWSGTLIYKQVGTFVDTVLGNFSYFTIPQKSESPKINFDDHKVPNKNFMGKYFIKSATEVSMRELKLPVSFCSGIPDTVVILIE